MTNELKIEILREALSIVLDGEADDSKEVDEWGGYRLDTDVRETIIKALEVTE